MLFCGYSFAAAKFSQGYKQNTNMATHRLAVRSAWWKSIYFLSLITDAKRCLTGSKFDISNDIANVKLLCIHDCIKSLIG